MNRIMGLFVDYGTWSIGVRQRDVYLVKYAWRFNLYRANVKTDRELLVRISED